MNFETLNSLCHRLFAKSMRHQRRRTGKNLIAAAEVVESRQMLSAVSSLQSGTEAAGDQDSDLNIPVEEQDDRDVVALAEKAELLNRTQVNATILTSTAPVDEVIISIKQGDARFSEWASRYLQKHQFAVVTEFQDAASNADDEALHIIIARLPAGRDAAETIVELNQKKWVEFAEPNVQMELTPSPPEGQGLNRSADSRSADPAHPVHTQYGLLDIQAAEAVAHLERYYPNAARNAPIVAVIDTGVDYRHQDLDDNIWKNRRELNGTPGKDDDGNGLIDDVVGWDFVDGAPENGNSGDDLTVEDNDPDDVQSHGTHVAGIIGAERNGIGIDGVAPHVQIMPVRAGYLNSIGRGSLRTADVVQSIHYAIKNGADIINASFADTDDKVVTYGLHTRAVTQILNKALNKGILVVAAAGNIREPNATAYPAAYQPKKNDNIISVAASSTGSMTALSGTSKGRESVDLYAPGSWIPSTIPEQNNSVDPYDTKSGTSMAAPHVAGVAAMLLSAFPKAKAAQLKLAILESVDQHSFFSNVKSGGRLNAYKALLRLEQIMGSENARVTDGGIRQTGHGTTDLEFPWLDDVVNAYPPQLIQTIPTTIVVDEISIPLEGLASDRDGSPLRWSVESSNSSVIAARIEGTNLWLRPLSEGAAEITLSVDDHRWVENTKFQAVVDGSTLRERVAALRADAKQVADALQIQEQQQNDLQKQLDERVDSLKNLKDQAESISNRVDNLRNALNQAKADVQQAQSKHSQAESAHQAAVRVLQQTESALKTADARFASLDASARQLNASYNAALSAKQKAKQSLDNANPKNRAARQQAFQAADNAAAQALRTWQNVQAQRNSAAATVNALQSSRQEHATNVQRAANQLAAAKRVFSDANTAESVAARDLANLLDRRDIILEKLKQLQKQTLSLQAEVVKNAGSLRLLRARFEVLTDKLVSIRRNKWFSNSGLQQIENELLSPSRELADRMTQQYSHVKHDTDRMLERIQTSIESLAD